MDERLSPTHIYNTYLHLCMRSIYIYVRVFVKYTSRIPSMWETKLLFGHGMVVAVIIMLNGAFRKSSNQEETQLYTY